MLPFATIYLCERGSLPILRIRTDLGSRKERRARPRPKAPFGMCLLEAASPAHRRAACRSARAVVRDKTLFVSFHSPNSALRALGGDGRLWTAPNLIAVSTWGRRCGCKAGPGADPTGLQTWPQPTAHTTVSSRVKGELRGRPSNRDSGAVAPRQSRKTKVWSMRWGAAGGALGHVCR